MQVQLLSPYPYCYPKTASAPAKQTGPSLPIPPPPSLPSNPYEEVTHYNSLAEAIAPILAEHPQIIAFGEFHPRPGYDYRSAKRAFAEDILPLLAQEGINDLIVEQILNDPQIIAELDKFYETGKLGKDTTPVLWDSISMLSDKQDLIKMLIKARELGIRIHPGGMTLEQAQGTIFRDDWCCNTAVQLIGWQYAEQAGRQASEILIGEGKRFAIYNGVKHHNLVSNHITEEEGGTNYGHQLTQRLGNNYVEVELYPVGGLATLSQCLLEMWGVPDWRDCIPVNGINLIERSSGHILIY